jgi:GT2 family glycosyltransferase
MGDAKTALKGVYWMATRRRVRGWSRLMTAASNGPLAYLRWTKHGEPRALERYRRDHPRRENAPRLIALVLNGDATSEAARRSVASIRRALGDVRILWADGLDPPSDHSTLSGVLSQFTGQEERAWLLPIYAGDEVSPVSGEIFARSLGIGDEVLTYWDEDLLSEGSRKDPWLKPDWDPLLFGALGGLLGASAVSIGVAQKFASGAPGGRRDVELLLMNVAASARPAHIPLILTHRRLSLAVNRVPAEPPEPGNWPSVSIIIPTRDRPELLAACLKGIERTEYPGAIQTIVVDNGSSDKAALELLEKVESDINSMVLRDAGDFNFSRLNNLAVTVATGELLCLLNNDVEAQDSGWLRTLVSYAAEEGVGAVGPQLLYPSGRVQHAGVVIGLGGAAGHVQKGVDPAEPRFRTWHAVTREVSAVTAAVMVLKKSTFDAVGGFDQEAFAVAFSDIDLCLRLKQRGLRNIYVADVQLLHRESESRGDDRSPVGARRLAGEVARLQERWGTGDYFDPHFNPLFSRLSERCVLRP